MTPVPAVRLCFASIDPGTFQQKSKSAFVSAYLAGVMMTFSNLTLFLSTHVVELCTCLVLCLLHDTFTMVQCV